jgi:hypothetical protein
MADITESTNNADPAEEEYEGGIIETPIAIRIARVVGGSILGIASVGVVVFLLITAQDRAAESVEREFIAQQEAIENAVPLSEELQEKYSVEDEDLESVVEDLKRFDETITINLSLSDLTEVQVDENRIVFVTDSSRYFFEASSSTAFDYLNDYLESEILPGLETAAD